MFPFCLSFSAFALSSAVGRAGLGGVDEVTLSLVFKNRSKTDSSEAGLIESLSDWTSSEVSTPKASPMHWTWEGTAVSSAVRSENAISGLTCDLQTFLIVLLYRSILERFVEEFDNSIYQLLLGH